MRPLMTPGLVLKRQRDEQLAAPALADVLLGAEKKAPAAQLRRQRANERQTARRHHEWDHNIGDAEVQLRLPC